MNILVDGLTPDEAYKMLLGLAKDSIDDAKRLLAENEELRQRMKQYRTLFLAYGNHDRGCGFYDPDMLPLRTCTCDFEEEVEKAGEEIAAETKKVDAQPRTV